MSYAWIIDRDHIADEGYPEGTNSNAPGVCGPHDAPEEFTDWLEEHTSQGIPIGCEVFKFRMYDDDGILYYTGRMITDEGDTEEACAGPLDDFGAPNAGATEIKYHGHPEMDIG